MPTRYILAANQTVTIKVPNSKTSERICCHQGTPKGMRISITTGEVKGINENTVETVPLGSSITVKIPTYTAIINGINIGSKNCCVSVSLSTAAPMAA